MKMVRVSDHASIVEQGKVADRFWTRLKGLIGRETFSAGEGLLFPRNNSIHMWGMSISIDVVFLRAIHNKKNIKKEWSILQLHSDVKPWKGLPLQCFQADDTLELPQGTIARFNLKPGEVLCTDS